MAVLPPTLMLGVMIIFIITSIHNQSYTWEVLFFGLQYFLEPSSKEIALYAKHLEQLRKSKLSKSNKSPTATTSIPPLEIRRATLTPLFFQHDEEFPYHKSLDHVLTCTFAYLLTVLLEDILACIYPQVPLSFSVHYLTLPVIFITIFDISRISMKMMSSRVFFAVFCGSVVVAMMVIVTGDGTLFKFDSAYGGLVKYVRFVLLQRFGVEVSLANVMSEWVGVVGKFMTGVVAGASAMCMLVPCYRYAQWDYEVLCQIWKRGREEDKSGAGRYDLPKRGWGVVAGIVGDFVGGWVVVVGAVGSMRWGLGGGDGFGLGLVLIGVVACVFVKFGLVRARLQVYLDKALVAFETFELNAKDGPMVAGHKATVAIVSKFYYLPSVAFQYLAPLCLIVVYSVMAKRGGNLSLGICRHRDNVGSNHLDVFFREIGGFLGWWTLLAACFFSTCTHIMLKFLDKLDLLSDPQYKHKPSRRERRKYQAGVKKKSDVS